MPLSAAPAYTGCPLYENEKIIQQPADFLQLSQRYVDAATSFIHDQAGVYGGGGGGC